jgi:outer membrane lipoprotein-sorting protein
MSNLSNKVGKIAWASPKKLFAEGARVFVMLLALAQGTPLARSAETNSPVSAWLAAQTNVQTWSADFIQTRAFKTLTQPLTESGHVWFAAPNRFRWELGRPVKTIAVRESDEMLLIYPLLKRVERYPLSGAVSGQWRDAMSLLEAGFPRSETEMNSHFRALSQNVTNGVCALVLQPKAAAARKMMPQLEIEFDLTNSSLRATELQFADGSSMRNDFTNTVLNPTVDQKLFAPDLPGDYKIVEPLKK